MNKEQFIATLQACYFGDKGAYNKILSLYDENQQLHNKIDKAIDVIHTQMKNNPNYKENLKIIEINLTKGSCDICDLLKDSEVNE